MNHITSFSYHLVNAFNYKKNFENCMYYAHPSIESSIECIKLIKELAPNYSPFKATKKLLELPIEKIPLSCILPPLFSEEQCQTEYEKGQRDFYIACLAISIITGLSIAAVSLKLMHKNEKEQIDEDSLPIKEKRRKKASHHLNARQDIERVSVFQPVLTTVALKIPIIKTDSQLVREEQDQISQRVARGKIKNKSLDR